MGTILIVGRFAFRIYSNEPPYEGPHIHVVYGRGEAKFLLNPLQLVSVRRMAQHDVADAARLVAIHREFLERAFREHHPDS